MHKREENDLAEGNLLQGHLIYKVVFYGSGRPVSEG
jgi:hypothetical protein